MSRVCFVAGNWKMNGRAESAIALAQSVAAGLSEGDCEVAICPPSLFIAGVESAISKTSLGVGAQNMLAENDGAFTGEINAAMLLDVGCKWLELSSR